jgi:protein phosphatase PTC7
MVFILLVILLSTDRWAEKDVNPALFSRELMRNSSSFLNDEGVCLAKHYQYY